MAVQRTRIRNYQGILLAEWVSTDHLRPETERRLVAQDIGGAVEYAIPRPDLQRRPRAKTNTHWIGGRS